MNRLFEFAGLAILGISLSLSVSCRKNAAAKHVDETLKQPLAVELMTAIEKQEFDKVVPAWMNARMTATNQEQQIQFTILSQQAKLKLYEPAITNAKAAEALSTIRMMTGGGR